MARVIWKKADGSQEHFALEDIAVLGRDAGVDWQVNARGVSRRHARIESRGSGYFILDLGSTNGTLINGHPLEKERELRAGDTIQIGTEKLQFESDVVDDDPGGIGAEGELEAGVAPHTRSALVTEPLSRTLARESPEAATGARRIRKLPEVLPRDVGKFRLEEKLGQGGMGAVYLGNDRESGRDVAVKFIRQNIGRKEAFLEYFHHREAVLAREIDHPNVIRIYEHGVEEEQHYISMEYVRGENLYEILKRRRLSPAETLEILRQSACGLAAAHRQGVVHSDIKPANILLASSDGSSTVEADDSAPRAEGDVGDDSILEFDTEDAVVTGPWSEAGETGGRSRDEGLRAEIERRVGQGEPRSPQEVLVDPPYFERPSEIGFLRHYVDRISEKRGFFVWVEGETGTGKDRLLSEFLVRERADVQKLADPSQGVRFLELDCSRIEGIPRLYSRFHPEVTLAKLSLREMVDGLQKRFLENDHPTVVRILDVGKAPPLVAHLIGFVASLMEKKPVTLIATLDPDEMRQNDTIKGLVESTRSVSKQLYLRPLTEYQIQRYLQVLFPDGLAGKGLASDLYRLSEGNFARLLDLLRSFFERGVLRSDSTSAVVQYRPNFRELQLEEGKNLYEKYRSYGKLDQRALEAAAFIGQRFFFDTLQKLVDIEETSLFFVLRKLLAEGFFAEESRTWYRFTNVTFQRYMAERVAPPERPHMHRKVTRLLQTVPVPESAELFQLRAKHFAGCREYAKAVQCYLEGAHLARNEYQVDLVREMYQEILTVYRELGSREGPRKEVVSVLRDWFRRDGNWYEILGEMGAEETAANVKIADFGISFRMADEERGYRVGKMPALGTPRYLAPERGKGEPGGTKSDIFSLGIIAYEMVVSEAAFPGLKGSDLMRAYRVKPVRVPRSSLDGFPEGFDTLMRGMLEIDPARRWDAERVVREIVKLQFDLKMRPR